MPIRLFDRHHGEAFRKQLNNDPEFALVACDMALSLVLDVGSHTRILTFQGGQLNSVGTQLGQDDAIDIRITGTEDFWRKLLLPLPPPRFQNLYAGVRFATCNVSGNSELYNAYYAALTRMIEVLREFESDCQVTCRNREEQKPRVRFEDTIGRYVYLNLEGLEYRVYYEESGTGIPLVCQHTAGSDGQQWRQFLADKDITESYRVIVPDLPYHGKSLPPESLDWWAREYRLTKSFFIAFHLALNRALELERPVFIGSSMGGSLATDLALDQPDQYRAVIALEEGLRSAKTHQADAQNSWRYYRHPRVNGADRAAASMYCLSGPQSPKAYRHEVSWGYSQGAPGVFAGDLYYRHVEHDLNKTAHLIDTTRCPVYILNGEYDPGTGIAEGEALAAKISGAKFIALPDLGHFPMTEDFRTMKPFIMPVLEEIAKTN